MARQHVGTAVISEGHKEVVNIGTAGAASKGLASIAIRIRPSSLKPLFGTPLVELINERKKLLQVVCKGAAGYVKHA